MMPSIQSALVARQSGPLPPTGPLDMSTNAPSILAISGAFSGFAILIVLARIYVRTIMLKTFGADDYFIVAAMICGVGVLICFIGETHHGMGMHTLSISLPETIKMAHWNFFHSIIVMVGISLVKVSIAFFLLRLVTGKMYKIFLVGMLIFLTAFTIACAGTLIFACIPVEANWDFMKAATAKCYPKTTFTAIGLFNSTVNIVTDVIFACLPIPIVWNLQVNMRTRVSLIAILSLGFFACAAAIVKTVLQSKVFTTPDYTRNDSYAVWNNIELNVGIIAACLPALRPLFSAILDGAKALTTRATGLRSSTARQHRYYIQDDSAGGIKMASLPGQGNKYDVKVTTTSHSRSAMRSSTLVSSNIRSESEEDLKERERVSDDLFIMREGRGIMKSVDVSVHR